LLRPTTDGHKASRGLSATAELLVVHHLHCCHPLEKGATVLQIVLTAHPRVAGLSC